MPDGKPAAKTSPAIDRASNTTAPTRFQGAGEALVNRLLERGDDREPTSGPEVAKAQMMTFRDWKKFTGKRFAELRVSASRPSS